MQGLNLQRIKRKLFKKKSKFCLSKLYVGCEYRFKKLWRNFQNVYHLGQLDPSKFYFISFRYNIYWWDVFWFDIHIDIAPNYADTLMAITNTALLNSIMFLPVEQSMNHHRSKAVEVKCFMKLTIKPLCCCKYIVFILLTI